MYRGKGPVVGEGWAQGQGPRGEGQTQGSLAWQWGLYLGTKLLQEAPFCSSAAPDPPQQGPEMLDKLLRVSPCWGKLRSQPASRSEAEEPGGTIQADPSPPHAPGAAEAGGNCPCTPEPGRSLGSTGGPCFAAASLREVWIRQLQAAGGFAAAVTQARRLFGMRALVLLDGAPTFPSSCMARRRPCGGLGLAERQARLRAPCPAA